MQSSQFFQPVGCEAGPAVASSWTLCSTRRALESLIAAVALAVSMPLMFVIAFAVRLSSGGPVLFRQRRMGRNGMEFTLFKFRSMKVNSNEAGSLITVRGDRRITAVGAFLRRYKLDELPQFWNVLTGDMSLVGPRPIVRAELLRYGRDASKYLAVKPGLTGLWQIKGRSDTTYRRRVAMDRYYVQNRNILLDIYIVAATPAAVLRRSGAY